jgi:type I restriction enzyme, S subunit
MVRKATGASYPAVTDRIVLDSALPLPSLPEQRRIAEILDKADALRAKRRAALAQLDTLTQSIFLDMFGDPATNPKGWPVVPIGEHASKIGSGATPLGGEEAYKPAGIALIRSMNVRDGAFQREGLAFIDGEQAVRLEGVVVEANDVLLNITGASVARVCRAPADVLPARVNQHVAIIRPTGTFDALFLEQCLLSPTVKERLLKIARAGATREAITKAAIEQFKVIRPPREMQNSFAARADASEGARHHMDSALAELEALFASLQHRAFRGDL